MSEVQFDIIMMEFKLPQISGADVARMIRDTKSVNSQTPIIAVTGYLNELPQAHHFDALIEKPATVDRITEVLQSLCFWRPPVPSTQQPKLEQQQQQQQQLTSQNAPKDIRKESQHIDDSPSSQSSGPFSRIPGFKRSSRENSIGSSFFGDTDSTNAEDIPGFVGRPSDDWPANKGLGISKPSTARADEGAIVDSPPVESYHPGLPHLIHQNSAPPSLNLQLPRKKRSAEAVKAKREGLQANRAEGGESGDDEDEELGAVQIRTRSPRRTANMAKRSSKLGIEMMRTNSRGSIDEGGSPICAHPNPKEERADQIAAEARFTQLTLHESPESEDPLQMSDDVPATSLAEQSARALERSGVAYNDHSITPPERFPAESKGGAVMEIDMDATPRPPASTQTPAEEREEDDISLPIQMTTTPTTEDTPKPKKL